MRPWVVASLASLLALVGPAAGEDLTVYRCQDAGGRITLQDEPCPAGQQQSARSMVRPRDPAPAPRGPEREPEPVGAAPPPMDYGQGLPFPPPPLFQCTDFDGAVRFSETYDPNTRCVPLPVLGANVVLTASTKIIDVTGAEPVEYRGYVPERSVVIPGSIPKEFGAGTYQVPCALIIGQRKASTDQKTSLNDALREFQVAV